MVLQEHILLFHEGAAHERNNTTTLRALWCEVRSFFFVPLQVPHCSQKCRARISNKLSKVPRAVARLCAAQRACARPVRASFSPLPQNKCHARSSPRCSQVPRGRRRPSAEQPAAMAAVDPRRPHRTGAARVRLALPRVHVSQEDARGNALRRSLLLQGVRKPTAETRPHHVHRVPSRSRELPADLHAVMRCARARACTCKLNFVMLQMQMQINETSRKCAPRRSARVLILRHRPPTSIRTPRPNR